MMRLIDANEVRLQKLLSTAQETYKVPLHQRPYAWERDQWQDLFEDITNLSPEGIHFFGSIVVVPEGKHRFGINCFEVVDGQQRLATILIWLSVFRDMAKEEEKDKLAEHITETYLFAKEWKGGEEERIPRLHLGELDDDAFQRVLKGERRNYSHLIFKCYDFFKKNTKTTEKWQILDNISIVHINAFNHFNAFRLFETLNDRGLELSAADLIKNFFLMKVSGEKKIFRRIISEWNEMYEKVRDKEPVKFIRRYVLSNYKGKVSESRLYEGVGKRMEGKSIEDVQKFTVDLNSNATIYKKICEANFSSRKCNETLENLHLVEVAPSFTLLLKVLPYLEANKISENDVLQIMKMIEIFHLRWGICGQSTAQLDQIYNTICIRLSKAQPKEFLGQIKEVLNKQISSNVDDEIFKSNFSSRLYKPADTRTKYILWKLSEPTGETLLNIKEIQTEHIMPVTLSEQWIEYLKDKTKKNEKEILALHQENLNRIGNLAIIKGEWNQRMSNRLFDEKKRNYEKSEFVRTKELKTYHKWTLDEINERCEKLVELVLKIWRWEY